MSDARERLTTLLAEADERVASLERQRAQVVAASAESNADDEHDPEGATIAFEREQLGALLERARATRGDAVRALTRLDDGTYGVCESCGEPIDPARLDARPAARTCLACARG